MTIFLNISFFIDNSKIREAILTLKISQIVDWIAFLWLARLGIHFILWVVNLVCLSVYDRPIDVNSHVFTHLLLFLASNKLLLTSFFTNFSFHIMLGVKNDEHLFGLLLGNECHLFKITIMQIFDVAGGNGTDLGYFIWLPLFKRLPGAENLHRSMCPCFMGTSQPGKLHSSFWKSPFTLFVMLIYFRFLNMRLSMRLESSSLIYTFVSTLLRMARKAFAPICGRHCGKEKRDPAFIRR